MWNLPAKFFKQSVKIHFLKNYQNYKYNNSINLLNSNTGKASKKEKGNEKIKEEVNKIIKKS